jgi:hypothetical protein
MVLQKLSATNYDTGWATPASDFITAVTAPLSVTSGNLSVNLSTYLPLAGGTMDANAEINLEDTVLDRSSLVSGSAFAVSSASNPALVSNVLYDRIFVANAAGATSLYATGVEFPDLTVQTSAGITAATASSTYQTLAGMSSYLTTSTAASTYYPLSGNPSGFLTSAPVTSVAGRTGAITLSNTDISGLGSLAVVNDAPSNGSQYARKNGAWDVVSTTPDFISSVSSPLAVTTGNLTVDLSAYATLASPVFTGDARAVTATFGDNDTSIATTAFVQAALAGGTAIAQSLEVEVRNQSGASIPAGSIVYISGATGNKPLITLAQANNDANSAQTMGFTKTAIANNAFGFVIIRGEVENLDTSALTEGVQLYLSPTVAGAYTTTKPSAPLHLVYVGIVIRSHPTLGTILVAVQNGYELGEIHDVAIGTLADNNLLAYESSTDLWKNKSFATLGLLTSATAATTYAPIASAALTGNVTITTNSTSPALFITQTGAGNILTLYDQATDTNFVAIDQNGKINTIVADTTTAGLNIPHTATAPTSPVNGDIWTTTGGLFARINGGSVVFAGLGTANTFTNNTVFSAGSLSFGTSTGAATINVATGATATATVKALNLGSGGLAGSTTNIAIGSTTGTSTTTLQGTTNGITAAADTNSVALATTAFVVGQASATTPAANGTAAVGTSLKYARADHVHASDTTKANLASPTFTGTPTLPTGTIATTQTAGNNTTAVATTAFVTAAIPGFATTAEIASPSSTTKMVAPNDVVRMLVNRATFDTQNSSPTFATSGAGATAYMMTNNRALDIGTPNILTAGYGQMIYDTTAAAWGVLGAKRGDGYLTQDWSKRIWMSGTHTFIAMGDANTTAYCMLGGRSSVTTGDPTKQAIGWKLVGGSTALKLITYGYNGSALVVTETASSFTPVVNQSFDWMIVHAPNPANGATSYCYLYVNDALVATGINAPADATVNYNWFYHSFEASVTATARMDAIVFPTKVWWSRS